MNRSVTDNETLSHLVEIIRASLAEYSWLFGQIKEHNGSIHFPEQWISFLTRIEQPPWATFYGSEQMANTLALFAVKGIEGVSDLQKQIEGLSADEVRALKIQVEKEAFEKADVFDEKLQNLKLLNSSDIETTLASMSELELEQETSFLTFFLNAVVVSTFNFLAIITHGKSMVRLIHDAQQGEDSAFLKAVQIDATVLSTIPYFKQRLVRSQLSDEPAFRASLARGLKGKVLSEKVELPELRFVFALLHSEGFLTSLPNDQLLDICIGLGIYQGDDVYAFSKLKNKFLKKQGPQI
ncbi:MAG: hypothetical protein R3F50_20360 [Gammaproteobacteria bacterium]